MLLGISGAKSHYRSQVGPIRGPNACLWALGSLVFASKKLRCTYIGQDWVGEGIGRVLRGHPGYLNTILLKNNRGDPFDSSR